ncbi:hypothetical protein DFJ73DRAFT_761361 [Zopfochytrium polystomum]|nr:hypothetical protein DFJ73DRAFT_761361 [Zopfochytrium polystomum]
MNGIPTERQKFTSCPPPKTDRPIEAQRNKKIQRKKKTKQNKQTNIRHTTTTTTTTTAITATTTTIITAATSSSSSSTPSSSSLGPSPRFGGGVTGGGARAAAQAAQAAQAAFCAAPAAAVTAAAATDDSVGRTPCAGTGSGGSRSCSPKVAAAAVADDKVGAFLRRRTSRRSSLSYRRRGSGSSRRVAAPAADESERDGGGCGGGGASSTYARRDSRDSRVSSTSSSRASTIRKRRPVPLLSDVGGGGSISSSRRGSRGTSGSGGGGGVVRGGGGGAAALGLASFGRRRPIPSFSPLPRPDTSLLLAGSGSTSGSGSGSSGGELSGVSTNSFPPRPPPPHAPAPDCGIDDDDDGNSGGDNGNDNDYNDDSDNGNSIDSTLPHHHRHQNHAPSPYSLAASLAEEIHSPPRSPKAAARRRQSLRSTLRQHSSPASFTSLVHHMFAFLGSPATTAVAPEPSQTPRFDSLPKEEMEAAGPMISRIVARMAVGEQLEDELMDEPPPLSPPVPIARDEAYLRRMVKRDHAAKEILSTEKHYNKVLLVIQKVFLPRLRSVVGRAGEILDKKAIDEIFSNIEDIMPVNAMLLELLQDKIESPHWNPATSCLGEIFMKLAPFLKMYSTYYANFSKALAVISDKMSKRPAFERFLKEMARLPECSGLRLDAFLLEPIQRIPRYKMLLEELMKYTDADHPDFEKLSKAVNIVSQVASQMNEKVRLHEMFLEMLNIQSGQVTKGADRPISTKFGVDDNNLYYYKQKLYLDRCSVTDVPDSEYSPQEKEKWMKAIQSVITELEECRRSLRTSVVGENDFFQAPVWVPNQARSNCKLCSGDFTLIRRRSFVIPAFKDKPRQVARACDTCFESILNDGVLKPASPPLSTASLNRPDSTEPFEGKRNRSSMLSTTSTISLSNANLLWTYERCTLCGDTLCMTNPKVSPHHRNLFTADATPTRKANDSPSFPSTQRHCHDCSRVVCYGCSSKDREKAQCDACFYDIPPSQVVVFESGGWSSALGIAEDYAMASDE